LLADNNKEILPCEYGYIGEPHENLMLCNKGGRCIDGPNCKGGKYGYLDINGNVVIECIYDIATYFEDGIAQVEKDGVASLVSHPYKGTSLAITNGTTYSEIDVDIPQVNKQNTETFAFIVANENYNNFSGADYSINDGKIFVEYCKKTLGIPEHNVRYSEDATYGNLVSTIKKIEDIASVYEGEATIILFYSGLGTIDEQTRERYILPTDASISSIKNTGFQVQKLMEQLNALKTKGVLVLLDAPFTGANKKGESFIKNRGIRISPKEVIPCGQTFICFSHDNNENSYMSAKYGHGLFTYCLLKKLKESKGNCTWKEWLEETSSLVKKESLQQYDNVQTPIYVLPEPNQLISNKSF
jgi:caspase domain